MRGWRWVFWPKTPSCRTIYGVRLRDLFVLLTAVTALACSEPLSGGPALSGARRAPLRVGEFLPARSEADAVGALHSPISRDSAEFGELVVCDSQRIVFKDEEGSGADRVMTPRLRSGLFRLSRLVRDEWEGVSLRVTEAWDEQREHAPTSLHYEARAADLTTSDMDRKKLGRLARLAVEARLDWVYYEDESHVHVSVKRDR